MYENVMQNISSHYWQASDPAGLHLRLAHAENFMEKAQMHGKTKTVEKLGIERVQTRTR